MNLHGFARILARCPQIPTGFEVIDEDRLQIVVRAEVRQELGNLLRDWAAGTLPAGRKLVGGRGAALAIDLSPELSVVLRHCRRGGVPAHINRDLFFGVRTRPFAELAVTEALRRKGVPTVEVLGAAVLWLLPACYRGALVTREVPAAMNLWQYLRAASPDERERVCHQVASATIRMHRAGAVHPDLNLQNYLVCKNKAEPEVLIIDCDGVKFHPVTDADRRAALRRILRSLSRLDPDGDILGRAAREALGAIVTGRPRAAELSGER